MKRYQFYLSTSIVAEKHDVIPLSNDHNNAAVCLQSLSSILQHFNADLIFI